MGRGGVLEKVEAYLNQYRDARREVQNIRDQITALRYGQMIPAMRNDGMPHSGGCADLSSYAAELDELEIKLEQAKRKAARKRKEIEDKIKDVDMHGVLFAKYIEFQSVRTIAVMRGWCASKAWKMIRDAEDRLEEKL